MADTYQTTDDEYSKARAFTAPAPEQSSLFVTRSNKGVRGWVIGYLGDDPMSDWTLYEPLYCTTYPDDHDFEAGFNLPDKSNDVRDAPWREPTEAVKDMMEETYTMIITDDRVARTIKSHTK